MEIDLVTLVVWGTAARIFLPDLRRAGCKLLATAVHAGVQHLHQQVAPASHAAVTESEA